MTKDIAPEVKKPSSSSAKWMRRLGSDLLRDRWLYLLMVPGIIYFVIFKYMPIYGLQIAFQEYNPFDPSKSPWVGFGQFVKLFSIPTWPNVIRNTLTISLSKLLFTFPAPIILALLMNEFRSARYKKLVQTVLYLPHFISWVIMYGIILTFVNPTNGFINIIIESLGGEKIAFLTSQSLFVPTVIASSLYKEVGWGTIIYFAAISAVEEDQFEAAIIDGANRFQQAWYITLPSIRSTIVVVLILNLNNILNAGFEQIFMMYSPLVYEVGDIIDTYVYREGVVNTSYSFSAAAGMFKSVVALIMITMGNAVSKKMGESGIF